MYWDAQNGLPSYDTIDSTIAYAEGYYDCNVTHSIEPTCAPLASHTNFDGFLYGYILDITDPRIVAAGYLEQNIGYHPDACTAGVACFASIGNISYNCGMYSPYHLETEDTWGCIVLTSRHGTLLHDSSLPYIRNPDVGDSPRYFSYCAP